MIFKKRFISRQFLRVAGLLLAVSLVLGLGATFGLAQDKVKLTWGEWWIENWGEEAINWIISSFEERYPNIKIENIDVPHTHAMERFLTICQAGETPDVLSMEATWAAGFDKLGVLEDLTPWFDKDPKFKVARKSAWNNWWNGRLIMTWHVLRTYGICYNMRMFKEKGLAPPADWNELREAIRKFKDPAKGRYGIAIPFAMGSSPHYTLYNFWTRLIQAGGRMINDEGRAAFNSDAGVRTLKYWGDMTKEGLVYPGTIKGAFAIGEKEMLELFAAEQVPLQATGFFLKSQILERAPEVAANVAMTPPFKDVTSGYMASGSGLCLSSESEHTEEAWRFLKYLVSDEVAFYMINNQREIIANTEVFNSPILQEDPVLRYVPEMLSDPADQPFCILPELKDLCDSVQKNGQEYLLGKKDAQTALDDAVEHWNKVILEAEAR